MVETENASRYLQQLCKHWGHKFTVDFTPAKGHIDLGEGRLVYMEASPTALTVEVEAGELARMEQVVADHILRFAFREELAFEWKPVA